MTTNSAPRTGKPREAQGALNHYIYHPLARRLARLLARTPVTPNMVSVAGALMVASAGLLYTQGGAAPVAFAFALHLAWHVVDGADGDLARLTGRASPIGEIVDGLCDYGGHVVLYLLLAATLDDAWGPWAWLLAVAAGGSRIVQSAYAESQRRTYLWWVYSVPWLRTTGRPAAVAGIGGALAALYLRLERLLAAGTRSIDAVVAAAEADPPERARIADLARAAARRTLPVQVMLGANPRTVLLGLSMIAGTPAWFFFVEATLLNLLLAGSIVQQRRASRRLLALIGRGRT